MTRNRINKIYICWNAGLEIDGVEVCAWTVKEARTIYANQMNIPFSSTGGMFLRKAPKLEG